MDKYSLVYIDDKPEAALTEYLDRGFLSDKHEIEYTEITFRPEEGYESLLLDPKVRAANIVLIDSRLFENKTATAGKFSGEEFKLVLKKFYPFIEVIVITQNGTDTDVEKIPKYDKSCGFTAAEYYARLLPKIIDSAIANIHQYRLLADMVNGNDSWEIALKDKVISTLKGTNTYDELTKSDIDSLIIAFKEMQESLDE